MALDLQAIIRNLKAAFPSQLGEVPPEALERAVGASPQVEPPPPSEVGEDETAALPANVTGGDGAAPEAGGPEDMLGQQQEWNAAVPDDELGLPGTSKAVPKRKKKKETSWERGTSPTPIIGTN